MMISTQNIIELLRSGEKITYELNEGELRHEIKGKKIKTITIIQLKKDNTIKLSLGSEITNGEYEYNK